MSTVRVDQNSYSIDTTLERRTALMDLLSLLGLKPTPPKWIQLGTLDLFLTLGLDLKSFKWIEFGAETTL